MAHFSELSPNNIVLRTIVIGNKDCLDDNGQESEELGIKFCQQLFGDNTRWIQTSYNGNIRGKYANIGDKYDEEYDIFIPPSPFPSWVFNYLTYKWESPIPYPEDGNLYSWNEATQSWDLVPTPEEPVGVATT